MSKYVTSMWNHLFIFFSFERDKSHFCDKAAFTLENSYKLFVAFSGFASFIYFIISSYLEVPCTHPIAI
jgi:hypothetical protein